MILWCGGEDVDFPLGSIPYVVAGAANYRAGYARVAVGSASAGPLKSLPFSGGPVTSAWLACRAYVIGASYLSSSGLVGFGRSGSTVGALLVGLGGTSRQLALLKWNGTSFTQLAAESGASLVSNVIIRLDLQVINYGASATVNLYVNGNLLITYSGDVTVPGVTNLDSVWLFDGSSNHTSSNCAFSEIVAADEDPRLLSLVSLYPSRAGGSSLWGQSTAGVNGFQDIDDPAINDADIWYTDTPDQDAQIGLNAAPAGTFDVRAVKFAARCAKTAGATAGSIILGTNCGAVYVSDAGVLSTADYNTTAYANAKSLVRIVPTESASVVGMRLLPFSSTGAKMKALIYADASGAPAALLATSDEIVGTTARVPLDFKFSTPCAITSGTAYWIGFITDTAVPCYGPTGTTFKYNTNTYASGPSNPAGTMNTYSSSVGMSALLLKAGAGLESPMPSPVALDTAWATKERLMQLNPVTGLAFTQSEVNGLQINFRSAT